MSIPMQTVAVSFLLHDLDT